jgi:Mg2+-importing ATPase
LLRRFRNPLVLILIGASVVSALSGEVAGFVIIVFLVLLSVTLDFVQEFRANRAADALRESVEIKATVLRDGTSHELRVTEIVPGDVVMLSAGALVPADGRVLEARDLFVNQALLTGEAFPVEKHAADVAASAEVQDATNALFMGTAVISGSATLLVCRTGAATEIGRIAQELSTAPPATAFETGTRAFGLLIMRLTAFLVLFVVLVNIALHRPLLESLLFALALAVGLTPELLPMIVTVTLSRGALRMAAKHVIVKRLSAIQNLGSMDVLCTDKTGTLTEAQIRLERHVDLSGTESERVIELAWLNSHYESGIRSPLDDAILAHAHLDAGAWTKVDEVPFDFERRRISVLVDDGATRMLVVKGAPEDLLALSKEYLPPGQAEPTAVDDDLRTQARLQLEALGRDGFRVLGVAYRKFGRDRDHAAVGDEVELTFVGFAAFLDPPKASAAEALVALARSHVAVKVLTGDSELVTQHVCASLGLKVGGVLTGAEIAHMDDLALRARVDRVTLFCRVSPAQKNRIILALKGRGHVVGYLGDGINDAPALHSADASLSVDTAVDVAKAAADLILLRHDLHVLSDGVVEGRRTFANIRKYILMGTSSNFGNMFSMAGAALILPFLPMLPTQILLNNVLYDLSETAIPLDHVDGDEVRRPQHWDMKLIRNFMWTIGPISSLFDFLTFFVLLAVLHANEALFQTGWFVESLATQVLVIFVIRTRRNPFSSRPHPALLATSLAAVAVALMLPFTALGQRFGFQPPPPAFYAVLAALVAAYLVIVELVKRMFYARVARVR